MRLGIIGAGKMGGAIARAALRSGTGVVVFDNDAAKAAALAKIGAKTMKSIGGLAKTSDVVLVAVKPKDVEGVLAELERSGACRGKLLVSIAACVSSAFIAKRVRGCRVIRVIPNIPLEVGAGASAYALGKGAGEKDERFVKKLFGAAGVCEKVDEKNIDAAMVAGSCSPAFYVLVVNAIADECARKGLGRRAALRLAAAACLGTGKIVLEGREPEEIARMVATPGGITAEGLAVLERRGVWGGFREAARAALAKSGKIARAFR